MQTALALVAVCAIVAVSACGRSHARDRQSMCRSIFTERTTGIIKPFRERGPDNESAFMKLCVTLPAAYLLCELEQASRQSAKCARMLRESAHARRLNAVLVSGRDGYAIPSDAATDAPDASAGD